MTQEFVIDIGRKALEMTLMISAPVLGIGLIVGLVLSLFQAVTQIQEMTLTFVPKIFAVMIAIFLFLPWMMNTIISFTTYILGEIPNYIR
jgi:flagellar biosynthetic protein FliQ